MGEQTVTIHMKNVRRFFIICLRPLQQVCFELFLSLHHCLTAKDNEGM